MIVSGRRMPEVSGTELFFQVKAIQPRIIRVVLLRYINFRAVTDVVNQGSIYTRPPKPREEKHSCEYV